ncbi:MAG TPA: phage tail sheath subtilisin-like domain-containing protein [Actinomycetota bacterium]
MPVTPTYPGVYVEEVPSGVRTITGVATSIAAFVGRAERGPVNKATAITSFADFERVFGGLTSLSRMGFAVRDFFANGGTQAVVVRLYRPPGGANPKTKAKITSNNLTVNAADEGAWGNALRIRIDTDVSEDVATSWGLAKADLFNLSVRDTETGATEVHRNVTMKESPRQVDRVTANESKLIRADLPATMPTAHGALPTPTTDPWSSDALSAGVAAADKGGDGQLLNDDSFIDPANEAKKQGLYALENADLFNILCIPPYKSGDTVDVTVVGKAAEYCEKRRAILLVDPRDWADKDAVIAALANPGANVGTRGKNAALFFPRLRQPNPLLDNAVEPFAPCGAVAGVLARTDADRGVWKSPAGMDATLRGVADVSATLTDLEIGQLNPLGVNCLRVIQGLGPVVWGARTLQGDDRFASEWKYLSVRRTALFIEESLFRGTQWVVFEPNDEPLWAQIRLNIGTFMHSLFRQGAFAGSSPRDAYLVKCDHETTTQDDVNRGVVNVVVGFAPLKPAEFVIIKIQQLAGRLAS